MFRERVPDGQGSGTQWRTVYVDVTGAEPGDVVIFGVDRKWHKGRLGGDGAPDLSAEVAQLRADVDALQSGQTTTYFNSPDGYQLVNEVYYDPGTGDVTGMRNGEEG